MLARNLVLAVAATIVLVSGAGTSATHWVTGLSAAGAVALAAGVALTAIAAAAGTLALALLRRHGDTLLRLDALEAALAAHGIPLPGVHEGREVEGLPVGSPAPEVELTDLERTPVTLASLREPAKPLMLLFTDPGCGPCSALMPTVAEWQREHRSALRIAVISRGELDASRTLAREHGLTDVMVQDGFAVSESYAVAGTPSAVLIAPDGTVASPVHGGAEAIASLVALVAAPPELVVQHSEPFVATPAPDPMLRTLDGDRVPLREQLNGETAVLFWNPDCGYCDQMLPDLRRAEAAATTEMPSLLLISTGDAARNRAMALRAPILLDVAFDAASAFGATGTPSAVLVDEHGLIASRIAVGAPEVLALVGSERTAPHQLKRNPAGQIGRALSARSGAGAPARRISRARSSTAGARRLARGSSAARSGPARTPRSPSGPGRRFAGARGRAGDSEPPSAGRKRTGGHPSARPR